MQIQIALVKSDLDSDEEELQQQICMEEGRGKSHQLEAGGREAENNLALQVVHN